MLLDPAIGKNFFGRHDILELLKKRAGDLRYGYRQNIAIIGPSYYGKTSLIFRFINTIPFRGVVPIYLEVKAHGFQNFADKFISTLVFQYLNNFEYKIQDSRQLIPAATEVMPKTAKAVKATEALLKTGKNSKIYSALFELPAIAFEETNLRPVIILDEFHRLEELGIEDAFAILGKYIMFQKDTMYILSSSQINRAKEILSHKLSLLFGNFEVYELGTFDVSTASDFIISRLGKNGLPAELISFLISFTDGHPFYLDSVLVNLCRCMSAMPDCDRIDAISKVFTEILFDSKGILNQHFANIISDLEKVDQRYIAVLVTMSNGNKKLNNISASSGINIEESRLILERLIDLGWVVKYGIFYLIRDKVFDFWLKNVYQSKEYLLDVAYEPKITRFNGEIRNLTSRFLNAMKQGPAKILCELFLSFNNELIEIQKKSFKVPAFKKVHVHHTKSEGVSYLSFSNEKCLWAVLLGLRQINCNEIKDFLTYCRHYKNFLKRKIIISPCEMDINTKLFAKESKSWIWASKELKGMLDIAGKERIVLPDSNKAEQIAAVAEDLTNFRTA